MRDDKSSGVVQKLIAALGTAHGTGRSPISLEMAEWYLNRAEGSVEDAFDLYMLANCRVNTSTTIAHDCCHDDYTPKLMMLSSLSFSQARCIVEHSRGKWYVCKCVRTHARKHTHARAR